MTPAAIAAIEAEASRVYGINLVHVPGHALMPTPLAVQGAQERPWELTRRPGAVPASVTPAETAQQAVTPEASRLLERALSTAVSTAVKPHWPLPASTRERSQLKRGWKASLKEAALALAKSKGSFTSRDLISVQPLYNRRNEVLRGMVIDGELVTERPNNVRGSAELVYKLPQWMGDDFSDVQDTNGDGVPY